jgi:hypothetical protein
MRRSSAIALAAVCLVSSFASASACTSSTQSSRSRGGTSPPLTRDGVPGDVQQRSKEMFGEQQQTTFETYGETPSMQAGERFERDTKPVRPPERTPTPDEREGTGEVEEIR